MAAEEKKGFFGSKAFMLILVWIGLGVVLTVVMYSAMPRMQAQCAKWEAEMAHSSHGDEHGGGHDAHAGDAGHAEEDGQEAHGEEKHGEVHHDSCHTVSLAENAPTMHRNLAAVFHGMYGTDGKMKWATAWSIPNFLILITFLAWAAGPALNENFKGRREELAKAIEEAEKARSEAEATKEEFEKKISRMDEEIEALRQEFRDEAGVEKAKVVAEAEKLSERIRNEADFTAKQEVLVARYKLKEDAARLAVEIAERVIREVIDDNDRDRLLNEYLEKIMEKEQ